MWRRRDMPVRSLIDDDYAWMHAVLDEAMSQVRHLKGKNQANFDGEVFTRIRTRVLAERQGDNDPIRRIFLGRKKNLHFSMLKQEEKERLTLMFTDLKRKYQDEDDPEVAFQELENLLAGMRSSISKMANAASESVKVKHGIEELEEFLANV